MAFGFCAPLGARFKFKGKLGDMAQTRKKKKRKVFIKRMRRHLLFLLIGFTLFFVFIIGTIIYYNVRKGDDYNEKILSQKGYESISVPYKRGDIYDCNRYEKTPLWNKNF